MKAVMSLWIKGLISAAISGLALGIGMVVVDPAAFNFESDGLKHLSMVAIGGAIVGVVNYLRQSPFPVNGSGQGAPRGQ